MAARCRAMATFAISLSLRQTVFTLSSRAPRQFFTHTRNPKSGHAFGFWYHIQKTREGGVARMVAVDLRQAIA